MFLYAVNTTQTQTSTSDMEKTPHVDISNHLKTMSAQDKDALLHDLIQEPRKPPCSAVKRVKLIMKPLLIQNVIPESVN